ncbi:MAG: hypothetical protein ACFFD4_15215 [Candidatus Odinarchaeota archaeon]
MKTAGYQGNDEISILSWLLKAQFATFKDAGGLAMALPALHLALIDSYMEAGLPVCHS